MIEVINSVDGYHEDYVREAVERLQADGAKILKVERVSRMRFAILGEDVTHIHYEPAAGRGACRCATPCGDPVCREVGCLNQPAWSFRGAIVRDHRARAASQNA